MDIFSHHKFYRYDHKASLMWSLKSGGIKQNKSNFGHFFDITNSFKYTLKEITSHWNFKSVTQLTEQKHLIFKSGADTSTKSYT